MNEKVVILADGLFPSGKNSRDYLLDADRIICCDGAVEKLLAFGLEPSVIVGDLDSVSAETRVKYAAIIHPDPDDQESNDLSKAINYCIDESIESAVILGANGLREDHSIGNVSLLIEYAAKINLVMVSDFGTFLPILKSGEISSFPGQQVSVFSPDQGIKISSAGLKYPLDNVRFDNWWRGTLNEATGSSFRLDFTEGRVLLYLAEKW